MELTVKELNDAISAVDDSLEITFGSSRYSKRPLIFYRFKRRGDDLLQIELNELEGEYFDDIAEIDDRITVGKLRDELSAWKPTDKVIFGSTASDAIPLFSQGPRAVFSFNLDQHK